ncbi:hypothetical protein NK718_03390 [Alsobacter sp. SYSU M60028]|uniref:Phospholipase/carboxylesterase/thioesterase domain-containing protein n=1 Tax=Alsobacter ponti TaxID=2962936 RepID=A0ABT1LBC0_9HYPH|nr:alpha/beta hydrolase-fold protein [Alsobacter ponti]MCP8937548.1 hypothetical protein [Alsobacter ponti]
MELLQRNAAGRDYVVMRPEGAPAKGLPAILFLHGKGESGTDGAQTRVGLPPAILENPSAWPFLVVCPQKPDAGTLWPEWIGLLHATLEAVEAEFRPDPRRRYLTGLSQGGNGTLTLAKALPWRFAALAPVCGWADPMRAGRELADLPVWLFHGLADAVVPASCSTAIAECLVRDGAGPAGRPRLTLYPGLAHNSWDAAYREPELPGWLLSHAAPAA